MISYAGFGIAMGNAKPSVKAIAKHITLTNDMDGISEAIRNYIRI
jgi:hydroxymethylpyrimidine pyrophosphatase-like HAD family hydrolase